METIEAQKRTAGAARAVRNEGKIPAVLYGPKTETVSLALDEKQFSAVFREAGMSSLVNVAVEGSAAPGFIYAVQKDPVTGQVRHVDLYQPDLEKEVEMAVPLVFDGEPPAVADLGGTFLRNMHEIEVAALPQDLPHELTVNVEGLKTFEDRILVKDLPHSDTIRFLREDDELVCQVVPAQDVEAELEAPVQEDVGAVEEVGKAEEEKEEGESEEAQEESGNQETKKA